MVREQYQASILAVQDTIGFSLMLSVAMGKVSILKSIYSVQRIQQTQTVSSSSIGLCVNKYCRQFQHFSQLNSILNFN